MNSKPLYAAGSDKLSSQADVIDEAELPAKINVKYAGRNGSECIFPNQ